MKFITQIFKANSGFTLVEVLIAAAALGGLALVATQLTSDVDKTKKHFEVSTEITSIKTRISSLLMSSTSCENSMKGLNLSSLPVSVTEIRNGAVAPDPILPIYSAGDEFYNKKIKLNSMRIIEKNLSVVGAGKTGQVKLELNFEKTSTIDTSGGKGFLRSVKGGKDIKEFITLSVTTDASEVVQECFNDLLNAEDSWCTIGGGTYSTITKKCTFEAYTDFSDVNANNTADAQQILVSKRYINNLVTDMLDKRYVNANGGAGGPAIETLNDSGNTLTIGDSVASDVVYFNSRVSVGTTNAPTTYLRVGGVTGAIPGGWGGGIHAFDMYSTSGTIAVGNGNGTTTFGSGIISFMSSVGIFTSGSMGVGTDNAAGYRLNVNGNAVGVAWETNSDKRLKKNIENVKDPVEKLLGLRGVTFDWRNDEFPERNLPTRKTYGFVAQEMEKVIPELVSTDSNGFKSVQYQNITSILVEAFKEAWKKLVEVTNQVVGLDKKTEKLAKENEKLEKRVKELETNHRALAEENKAIKELICSDIDKKSKKAKICK